MSDRLENPPLINDPAREATASMHGCASQIWRSVLIWLDLQDTERMYLEGAEDIDLIHGAAAETTQVKYTAENITLRSPDVVEAINNAWLNQERNRDRPVRYRFLTTASVTTERGDPLGLGVPGLQLWERAREGTEEGARVADAERLRQFLLHEQRVSAAVQAFLRQTDASAVWERLISRVEWDTDAAEAPEVVQEIKNRLVAWGQPRGVAAAEAENVAAHLYEKAWSVATTRDADRFLVKADAIRAFDEKTRISVPQAALSTLLSVLGQTSGGRDLGALLPVSVIGQAISIGRAPSLRMRHFSRPTVTAEIGIRLANSPVVLLHGSTGTGKSTLAAEYVATASTAWEWADLRGFEGAALGQRLAGVANELAGEYGIACLVLDDIELPDDARALEVPLTQIANILRARTGRLVITSANLLPQRLTLALAVIPENSLQVPPFSRDDIAAFLNLRGCPSKALAKRWAALIELHTRGHPQLVHARVAALESLAFPEPSIQDLTETPSDVLEARTEARRLLGLLDVTTRELVCRLSLTTLAMQRKQAISIAAQAPPIADPGLAFDKLIGPWIERLAEDLYRASPLISNAGADIRGAQWACETHSSIAWGLLATRTLTPYDASAILLHGVASRDWRAVARLAIGTLNADADTWSALADVAGWFVLVGTGEGVSTPDAGPFSLFVIRMLQYRLAAAGKKHDAILRILAQFDKEIPSGQTEESLQLSRHYFLSQVLLRTEGGIPITKIIDLGHEYLDLTETLMHILEPGFRDVPHQALQGPDGSFDAASIVGSTLSKRIDDRPGIKELLDACEPLPAPVARRLLWFIGGSEAIASLMFTRAGLWESRQQSPDWAAARDLCLRAYHLARHWELTGLAQAAARHIAQIIDQHLEGRDEALRIADQLAEEIGWSPPQEDGRAAILLRSGDFAGALDIWRRILPQWQAQSELDLQQRFSCRDAAIAAARLDRWDEAADWLAEARARTETGAHPIYEAALFIDEGYARWRSGNPAAALKPLIDGAYAIERLPSDEDDERAYVLRKRAGHTVTWMARSAENAPPAGLAEPPPASCSGLDIWSGPKMPSTPNDLIWAQLLEFSLAVNLGDDLIRTRETQLVNSPYGSVRMSIGILRVRHRLRYLALGDLVEVSVGLAETMEIFTRYYQEGGLKGMEPLPPGAMPLKPAELPSETILSLMMSGIFALAARGAFSANIINSWRSAAGQAALLPTLGPWLDLAESLLVLNSTDAQTTMRDGELGWSSQILATVAVTLSDASRPAELLTAHIYWASTLPRSNINAVLPLSDIESLIVNSWLRLSNKPFLLRMPLSTVPDLQRACANTSHGWRKIGEVLAAAEHAVPATVPETMRRTIQRLIADGS